MAGSFSPQTIPSLTGWQAAAGTWERQPDTQLVGAITGHTGAQILAAETGLELAGAVARPQDIELRLDSARTELGKEGYELQIGVGGVQLTAATEVGLFYATRTLSQLLRQGPTLPYGRAVDRPRYEERGVTLCGGQVGIQMDWVERLLTEMADLKLNHLLLELKLKPAKHPESAAWHYYTRAQIRQLCHPARERHIDLIPEINSPGHLGIWLEQHPELQLVDRHGQGHPEMLDISKPQAVHYYLELVDEYLEAFDTPWFHMGADEYLIGTRASEFPALTAWAQVTYGAQATIDDAFTAFINTVADHVRAAGKRLRIWNDGVIDTQVVRLDPSVVVEFWYGQGISAAALAQRGTRILNATELLYWSRSAEFYRVDCRALWESDWQVGQLPGTALKPEHPALLGAKLSIWPDLAYLRTEGEVEQQVRDSLRLVSQLTWPVGTMAWIGRASRRGSTPWTAAPCGSSRQGPVPVCTGSATLTVRCSAQLIALITTASSWCCLLLTPPRRMTLGGCYPPRRATTNWSPPGAVWP
ncbi:Beta-N-acetylhexosaminidase precursor [Actinomyces bovis]|uniref:Beta-N-acetylhexosaminidase n=1 Tax=Actinomyces bovis TaxID=1658 RepID=A0ABY1VKL9_9ACTO|nr:family 20 glycosylhydrolase [Actinomyces bovis]SPT52565.1 Beta-N-acetylhexosaminidase precursor [Actinomyces bovis]VEG54341.1 Beta-N-acetylhexosaminidase precursor [Actinomyces israelii]